MTKQEEIRNKVYDIVLAARTEGIVRGKTKRFANWDTDEILSYLHSEGIKLPDGSSLIAEGIKEV